jgi:uncharacterized membrane protein
METEMGALAGSPSKLTAFTAIMTALVTIATMLIQIPIPATKGVFNIGDSMVYVSGLLFGPYVGAFSGGVGSMLSDMLSGYAIYAPATLVIKGTEGFVVGLFSRRLSVGRMKGKTKRILVLSGIATGLILILVIASLLGVSYIVGSGQLPSWLTDFGDPTLWIDFSLLVAVVVGLIASFAAYRSDVVILSLVIGGALMVIGYFLYELVLFGMAAMVEVPVNILQVLSGILIARPVYRGVKKAIEI